MKPTLLELKRKRKRKLARKEKIRLENFIIYKFDNEDEEKDVSNFLVAKNSRYGFEINKNEMELYFVDYYHGLKRPISISNGTFDFDTKFSPINTSRLIFIRTIPAPYNNNGVYLAKFDFSEQIVEVEDKYVGNYYNNADLIVLDQSNEEKFVIAELDSTDFVSNFHLSFGDFQTMQIERTRDVRNDDEGLYLGCIRLNGIMLSGLKIDENYGRTVTIGYWNFNLEQNETNTLQHLFDFEMDQNVELRHYMDINRDSNCYAWKDQICYLNLRDKYRIYNLYSLDVNTQKCTTLNIGYGLRLENLYINDEDYLICKNEEAIYRFALRKPEKLQNLTWFEMRRHAMMNENERLYETSVKLLSQTSEFQPFCF